ncbi:MAG: hypothetical protein J1F42_04500 [Lachnospiraceae bacterium]|nr:hypothetical protein [Lachnospiraceae bacterium]
MYNTKQLCHKPYSREPKYLFDLFSSISSEIIDTSFEIEQVKSASVFPEIASDDNKHVLYWDIQYWDFFERFLLELSYLLENNSYLKNFTDHVCSICFDYLSLKLLHLPALAYCIQVNRERRFGTETAYLPGSNLGEYQMIGGVFWNNTLLARLLVFNHELFHLYYQLKPDQKTADYNMLHKLADLYMDGDWTDFKTDSEEDKILLDGLHKLQHSGYDKFVEEASCDYRALIETVSIQSKIDSESQCNLVQHIQEIHDAFHVNQTFLSSLCNISSCWEAIYRAYISANSTEEVLKDVQPSFDMAAQMASVRNIIIPDFLDRLIMQKYGVTSYVNILDTPFVRSAFQKVMDKMLDVNFMVYAIEESLKLIRLPHFNPFELKDIVLSNAGYQ